MDNQPDDLELVGLLQGGQRQALGQIYDRYGQAVYRLARKMSSSDGDAEDLAQEVFLAFWKGVERYDPQRGSLLVFLLTITRSRALNKIRQNNARQNLVERYGQQLPVNNSTPTWEVAQLEELSTRMQSAMERLPAEQRQTLMMAYYGGHSQSSIAAQLQLPLGTVKTRSRQGLLKLKQLLQDLMPQP
jgi:RNA polymerase sigma-70 factor, ECF subfamily